jgi:hypothetical protein
MIILHILLAVNIVPAETHWCSWLQWFMHQIDVGTVQFFMHQIEAQLTSMVHAPDRRWNRGIFEILFVKRKVKLSQSITSYIVNSNSTWSRANFGKYIKFTHWIQLVHKKLSYVIYLKFQECRLYVVNCLIDFYWLHAYATGSCRTSRT